MSPSICPVPATTHGFGAQFFIQIFQHGAAAGEAPAYVQSHWTAGTWQLASAGLLTFGREEAAQIRLGSRRIQASQVIRQG